MQAIEGEFAVSQSINLIIGYVNMKLICFLWCCVCGGLITTNNFDVNVNA